LENNVGKQNKRNIREIVIYTVFGVLTTGVNFVALQGLELFLNPRWGDRSYLFSQWAAWVAALVFAFFVNKIYVFRSKTWKPRVVAKEASTFVTARLLSFIMDYLLIIVFNELVWPPVSGWFTQLWEVDLGLPFSAFWVYRNGVKFGIVGFLVLVFNYFASKYVIFKKKDKREEDPQ